MYTLESVLTHVPYTIIDGRKFLSYETIEADFQLSLFVSEHPKLFDFPWNMDGAFILEPEPPKKITIDIASYGR